MQILRPPSSGWPPDTCADSGLWNGQARRSRSHKSYVSCNYHVKSVTVVAFRRGWGLPQQRLASDLPPAAAGRPHAKLLTALTKRGRSPPRAPAHQEIGGDAERMEGLRERLPFATIGRSATRIHKSRRVASPRLRYATSRAPEERLGIGPRGMGSPPADASSQTKRWDAGAV